MVCSSVCADRRETVRVLSDCWASSTFALGFLVRAFAGEVGVVGTRLGVEAATGASRLSAVGHKGCLAAWRTNKNEYSRCLRLLVRARDCSVAGSVRRCQRQGHGVVYWAN